MSFFAVIMTNLGLAAAVSVAIWVTKSPWPLLAFVFTMGWRSKDKIGICPECRKTVVLLPKDEPH